MYHRYDDQSVEKVNFPCHPVDGIMQQPATATAPACRLDASLDLWATTACATRYWYRMMRRQILTSNS